jgi:pimeloyl-ACP methyl ester carboxylesterase
MTLGLVLTSACRMDGSGQTAPVTNFSGSFNVAGHRVFLECRGRGSPTVVLIAGAGVASDSWDYVGDPADTNNPPRRSPNAVAPKLAHHTRVCAYDRPGTTGFNDQPSRSSPVPQPTTAQGDAQVLSMLLRAANVRGPYLLVAHSWGGFIATTYSRIYPRQVAGLVLIDPGSRYLQTVLPPNVWTNWIAAIAAAGKQHPKLEQPDYPASIAFLATVPAARRVPAVVLTSDEPIDFLGIGDAPKYHPHWVQAQTLLARSLGGTQITKTRSGHFIQTENPQSVIRQTEKVLATIRHGR